MLRPYVSAGFSDQSIGQNGSGGRNRSTFANVGAGAKLYFTENFYARAGVEAQYNIDQGDTEWAPSVGIGVNFGGGSKKVEAAPVEAAPAVCSDSDNDGVCDNVDKCPNTPANVTVDANGCPAVAEVVRVQLDVKFDFDKSVVKPNSYSDIKNLADFMKQYPQTTTTVEGHTDSVGPDAYNQKLSQRRADAVKQVLVNQYGVGGNRVQSKGYGETRPVADNATDAGRAVNRRVEAEVEAQAK
jgi:OOP family OmpA-OmpF porin